MRAGVGHAGAEMAAADRGGRPVRGMPGLRGGNGSVRRGRGIFCGALLAGAALTALRAETVALWLFDEEAGAAAGALLSDAGPAGRFLRLGPRGTIVPGKFGRALQVVPAEPLSDAGPARFAARSVAGDVGPGGRRWVSPTASKLNLGAHDWTLEAWVRLDPTAMGEGVMFEIGAGLQRDDALVTRFSVVPRENALVFAGLAGVGSSAQAALARRVEFPDPSGPPAGEAELHQTTLALTDAALPRDRWFHVALVHRVAAREVRLFVDGRSRAVAAVSVVALPPGERGYVSIGTDAIGDRPWQGALDELRVSDEALYGADFTPPASFATGNNQARRPAVGADPR
ncbi:LamG domain-containing protein [Horticoccus sp. 23ND18S-11]|uniref:LamG domain-containing protein n=1 Tax=Horticoccus sp. 23ND18S-11 TaxID=3391832 RepID=UPI0039C8C7DF